jgi:hypothetical protein
MMYRLEWTDTGAYRRSLLFDIDVIPQRDSPYARESANKTIMDFWNGGMFNPENMSCAIAALKNMNFDGKQKLIADMQTISERQSEEKAESGDMNG